MSSPNLATPGEHRDDRLANLIADGMESFPADLGGPDRDRLAGRVRRHRRRRLLAALARIIAREIYQSRAVGDDHVKESD